jgi:putative flippase GtrA
LLNFFNQFGKFAAIGFTNAAVDFGVLNILISQTGFLEGRGYAGIKSISFIVALLSSYVWNKYWAFKSNSGGGAAEFFKFFLVTIVSFVINVGSSSMVVTYISPLAGIDPHAWANVGAVVGSALGLIFSFVGFKFVVFRQ